jgi:hypothetical protein
MQGVITTIRGRAKEWPEQQSKIWKRNATAADLQAGLQHIGETVQFTRAFGDQPPPYRIVGVRLDQLNRLIADLECEIKAGQEENEA